jgi:POT family proton-dependent oligopeptide transporter
MASLADDRAARTFLGHPRGLYVLFIAEMWERFSYYGMRAILIFYLTKHFLFGEQKAYLIYGAYTSLVYITPVIGGYLADRYLGARKAVLFGGALIAIGHLTIALVEGPQAAHGSYLQGFYLGLGFIIVGTGFLKANVATIVGDLYPRDDIRRDPAYSIFYMGINVGGAIGPIICGLLGESVGWSWGFGAAGVGMLLGLVNFVIFQPALGQAGLPRAPELLRARTSVGISREWAIYLGALGGVGAAWLLIQRQAAVGWLLLVFALATFALILWLSLAKLDRVARHRIFAALFLIALNPLFWGLFEQAGGSMNLFTDRFVDRSGVPASLFQSINPIYIILLAPLFAGLWQWLGARGREPSAPAKFGLALLQMGLANLVMVWGAEAYGVAAMTPVIMVFLYYLLATTAELCLSPVGLSAMNRLAPSFLASLIMGAWFYMTAVGNFVAGKIGEATGGHDGEMTKQGLLDIYGMFGWISIGVAVVVLLLSPIVKRWMHLDTLEDERMAGDDQLAEPQAPGIKTKGETVKGKRN